MKIPNWNDLGNEPISERSAIAALMWKEFFRQNYTISQAIALAAESADALIAELKRRKEPQQ